MTATTTGPRASGTPTAARRSQVLRGHEGDCESAAFSPDGTRVVTAQRRPDRADLGRRERQGDRGPARPRQRRSTPPPSAPTGRASSRRSGTRPRGSGTPTAARRSRSCAAMRASVSGRRLQPRRHAHRHRVRTTGPPGSGTPRPARRSGSCAATRPGHERRLQPRRQRIVTASATTRPRGSGTPRAARRSRSCAAIRKLVSERRLQPRRRAHRHRVDWTGPPASGTPRAARSSRSCAGHADLVHERRLQPRRQARRHGVRDKTARIWDADSGKEIAVLRGHGALVKAPPSAPTATRIVTASTTRPRASGTPRSGKELAVLRGHGGAVSTAAFSPDGARIVTASATTPRASGTPPAARRSRLLRGHGDAVDAAAFSPDGARIVTAASRQDRAHLGRRDRRAARDRSAATKARSRAPPSAPTASASSPRRATAPRGSGTPTAARRSRSCAATTGIGHERRLQPRRQAGGDRERRWNGTDLGLRHRVRIRSLAPGAGSAAGRNPERLGTSPVPAGVKPVRGLDAPTRSWSSRPSRPARFSSRLRRGPDPGCPDRRTASRRCCRDDARPRSPHGRR